MLIFNTRFIELFYNLNANIINVYNIYKNFYNQFEAIFIKDVSYMCYNIGQPKFVTILSKRFINC